MCVIINKPAGVDFKSQLLSNLYHQNRDGFGLFYAEGGRVKVHKIAKIKSAKEVLDIYEAHKDKPLAIHLRWRTHGDIDDRNTHPYQVLDKDADGVDLWMAHNGVISGYTEVDKSMSDTWHFVNNYLKPILKHVKDPSAYLADPAVQLGLSDMVGGNKLLFMDGEGAVTLINRPLWKEHEGALLSNLNGLHTEPWNGADDDNFYGYGYYPPQQREGFKDWQEQLELRRAAWDGAENEHVPEMGKGKTAAAIAAANKAANDKGKVKSKYPVVSVTYHPYSRSVTVTNSPIGGTAPPVQDADKARIEAAMRRTVRDVPLEREPWDADADPLITHVEDLTFDQVNEWMQWYPDEAAEYMISLMDYVKAIELDDEEDERKVANGR